MSWKTLGEAMMSAIAQGMVDGDAGFADPAVSHKSSKRVGQPKPAPVVGETRQTEGETTLHPPTIGRHRRADETPHLKGSTPTLPARRCMLTVIVGGRTEPGGNVPVLPMLKPNRGERRAILRLVSG